jgi:hypothetical protein
MRNGEMSRTWNTDGRIEKYIGGKPEGNIPLLKASRKLEDSVLLVNGSLKKSDTRVWAEFDWFRLWSSPVYTIIRFHVPLKEGNIFTKLVTTSFSKRAVFHGHAYSVRI